MKTDFFVFLSSIEVSNGDSLSPVVSLNCTHVQMLDFVERSNNAASLSAVASCKRKYQDSCSKMDGKKTGTKIKQARDSNAGSFYKVKRAQVLFFFFF